MVKLPEIVLDHLCELGEGPVWDEVRQCILWVDITRGAIHQFFTKDKKHHVFNAGQMVGAIAPASDGRLIAALQHGFYMVDLEKDSMYAINDPEASLPGNRFNDGKCDPAGRFWAGTMSVSGQLKAGKLYLLNKDRSVSIKIDNVTCSNGMAWSPDCRTFYYIDTGLREVVAYDYNNANADIANRRSIIQIPPEEGYPDGMTIDSDGKLWIAMWGGWKVKRYDPLNGRLLDEIRLPVSLVTSCTFGGENLEDIYITTAGNGLSESERHLQPLAGSLFVVRQSGYRGIRHERMSMN
ncbi:SMP-30/gluconolactonase/LRE family protein [Dyadobacter aurulentus]|uniref:SMP-30/gluconolactonase/LRE family protein n=1 Tax=Dyadobacter sp. UC 10 TaxID=2605428 RepID=UPI0011F2A08B|nr:SMP-30/gluconolactonase/LRE family protein [Dyadobacter sp. UC 10]KAA0993526.1 SMP-30/gluconolactonase/LRE family protein [Dyadobacter sp. UC 10]